MRKLSICLCTVLLAAFILSMGAAGYAMDQSAVTGDENGAGVLVQTPVAEKRIRGEVSEYRYVGPDHHIVPCSSYKVYLLKENAAGADGELILEAKQPAFEIVLTEEQLRAYTYLEFATGFSSKVIKLDEIKDDPLQIVLEPQFYQKKPAIYLYPVQKTKILVTHHFKGQILTTYPVYNNNWTVVAEPDGDLFNVKDQRYYKYLFWDGVYTFPPEHYQYKTGFYVKNADYVSFLQSKLAGIGLNEQEINDFIVYWLPVMNKYQNCFVHFRINDDIDGTSVLETQPKADTVIRVFMEFSGIEDLSGVSRLPEQALPAFVRCGFTLVEWGGGEIGRGNIE